MAVRFPEAKCAPIDDKDFLAAWHEWFDRFAPNWAQPGVIPQGSAHASFSKLVEQKGQFSFDVLCRLRVPPQFRNTMQATPRFFEQNGHLAERALEKTLNAGGRKVFGVQLTAQAKALPVDLQNDQAATTRFRARLEADLEVVDRNEWKVVEDVALVEESSIADSREGPVPTIEGSDLRSLVSSLVDWIEYAPFQPMYRGKPYGAPVVGWANRLTHYFWPHPDSDLQVVTKFLDPLLKRAQYLAEALGSGTWTTAQREDALQLARDIFSWGGVPQTGYTADHVQSVFHSALQNRQVDDAPMNSGWTKVAAFASAHVPDGQVIWDSRVAHALVGRADRLLSANGMRSLPESLKNIGWIPGRGGTRHNPRGYRLAWRNVYRRWDAQFAASHLVREIRDELNRRGVPPSLARGGPEAWSLRTVEMVLFMDGY